ncbi:MAG: hypothetical protein V4560_12930 [Bacteroidota bacterium]
MKKILTLLSALFIVAGLKAQSMLFSVGKISLKTETNVDYYYPQRHID